MLDDTIKVKKTIFVFGYYGCEDFKIASQLARHFGLHEIKNMTDAKPTKDTEDLFRFMSKRDIKKKGFYIQRLLDKNLYALSYEDFKDDAINVAAVAIECINELDLDPSYEILPIYIEKDDKIRLIKLLQTSNLTAEEICNNFINDMNRSPEYNEAIDYSICIHNFRELIENEKLLEFIGVKHE